MKTLQTIKEEYARYFNYDDWEQFFDEIYTDGKRGRLEGHFDEIATRYAAKENEGLIQVLKEAEKHHQGFHSETGWKIRNAIKKATGEEVNYPGSEYYYDNQNTDV